jgi:hypothetical protein
MPSATRVLLAHAFRCVPCSRKKCPKGALCRARGILHPASTRLHPDASVASASIRRILSTEPTKPTPNHKQSAKEQQRAKASRCRPIRRCGRDEPRLRTGWLRHCCSRGVRSGPLRRSRIQFPALRDNLQERGGNRCRLHPPKLTNRRLRSRRCLRRCTLPRLQHDRQARTRRPTQRSRMLFARFLLLVRPKRGDPLRVSGEPVLRVNSGSRPTSIYWDLDHPMPAWFLEICASLRAASVCDTCEERCRLLILVRTQ